MFQTQASSNPKGHLFLRRLIRKKGIAGAQDDVFIEIKPIRKIGPDL
jgi:hypothetical protein